MIAIGFGKGTNPLISFAYGAGDLKTASLLRTRTNTFLLASETIMTALMMIFSSPYSTIFVKDESIRIMVRSGIFIFTPSFLLCGCNIITSFYFTSIGKALPSAVISSSRGLVVLLACIFTLPHFFGMTGIWLVSPVTESITIIISLLFLAADSHAVRAAFSTDSPLLQEQ